MSAWKTDKELEDIRKVVFRHGSPTEEAQDRVL